MIKAQALQPWNASWSAAQMAVCERSQLPQHTFQAATLRETVHLSLGGNQLRVRLSNLFGEGPLSFRSVTVARAQAGEPGAIEKESLVPVHFHGQTDVTILPGTERISDAVALPVDALSSLVVNLTIGRVPACITSHPGARATTFLLAGDHTADERLMEAETFPHWYFLSGVEVADDTTHGDVTVLGDSITDGRGSTDDANNRWTDVLAQRLAPWKVGVLNLGIGGNRVLADGVGPSALTRFDHDVLGIRGVRTLIVLEGINDIGSFELEQERTQAEHNRLVADLEQAFQTMVAKAHAHGIRVLGGTLTPFLGSAYYHPGPRAEADREAINAWIRTAGVFDGVIDFDRVVRDPAHPNYLAAAFDSGDHLHPGPEGYRCMGEGVPLELLSVEDDQVFRSKAKR